MTFLPDLAERLADVARRNRIPGAAIAVSRGGELAEAATGVLNLATGVETTTDSLFHIGSISKVYTSLLVMQLVEEGLVDLDDPVRRHLPGFRLADEDAAAAVTVRHLLTHTGGFDGDLFEDTGRGDDALDRFIAFLGGARQFAAPGELFSYCNSGFNVLGAIVARLRGSLWEDAVRARLLGPLSLTHTTLYAEEAIVFRVAAGHMTNPATKAYGLSPQWTLPRSNGPAGSAICAAPRDVARFGRLFLDRSSVASPSTYAAMTAPAVRTFNHSGVRHWGLGVMLFDFDGTPVWGHNGGLRGQSSYLRILPAHDLVIAASANGGGASRLAVDLIGALITELTGAVPPPVPEPPVQPSAVDVAGLIGVYEGPLARYRVDAADNGIDITLHPTSAAVRLGAAEQTDRYVHYDGDVFVAVEKEEGGHPTVTFVEGGRFLHNSRAHARVR